MTDIRTRKTDHIALSLQTKHQALHGSGLDRLSFEPNPLPQMSLKDVEINSQFLNIPVSAPFLI